MLIKSHTNQERAPYFLLFSIAFSELLYCFKAHKSVMIPLIANNKNMCLLMSLRGHAKGLRRPRSSLAHYDVSIPTVTHNVGEVEPTILLLVPEAKAS